MLVQSLLPVALPGPGMVIEWDMVPIAPVAAENSIAVPDDYGPYPSVMKWLDPSCVTPDYHGFSLLPQREMTAGCGAAQHFETIGEFLHFHYRARGRRPFGFQESRKACWLSLMAEHGFDDRPRPGLGDMVAAGLSAIGITPERVSKVTGKPCGCKERQAALNSLGRRLGIG
jgi:hypothetical protein